MSAPGSYHVHVELASGGVHRYSVAAEDAKDAIGYIERYCVPKDYPGVDYVIIEARLVRSSRL
jgi:hypothetical protein